MLIIVFSFHTFRDSFDVVMQRFDSLPSQGSLLGARSISIAPNMFLNTTNNTLLVVNKTPQIFVSRTTVKQENYNSSEKSLMDNCRSWCRGNAKTS